MTLSKGSSYSPGDLKSTVMEFSGVKHDFSAIAPRGEHHVLSRHLQASVPGGQWCAGTDVERSTAKKEGSLLNRIFG